jgi:hypothetical protein
MTIKRSANSPTDSGRADGHGGVATDTDTADQSPSLTPEDQARVDAFLRRGVNAVERKPFRPVLLMILLIVVVAGLSLFSQWLAHRAGVY